MAITETIKQRTLRLANNIQAEHVKYLKDTVRISQAILNNHK